MRLWTIWIQGDDSTWLESAWDNESTVESHREYEEALEQAQATAQANHGKMRVVAVDVPDEAIFGAFKVPVATGSVATEGAEDEQC